MNNNELNITIKANGEPAVEGFDAVNESVSGLEKPLKEIRAVLEGLRDDLKNIADDSKKVAPAIEGALPRSFKTEGDRIVGMLKQMQISMQLAGERAQGLGSRAGELKAKTNALGLTTRDLDALTKSLASDMDALSQSFSRSESYIGRARQAVEGFKNVSDNFGERIDSIKNNWASFTTGLNQGLELLGKAKRGFDAAWDISNQGAQFQETKKAFNDFTRSIGVGSEELMSKLRKSSGGTINDFELMKTASLAMSLGVTSNTDKMANLLEIARNKARLFGIGTKQAFEDIVTGVGRASPKILDNLGIRIPAAFEEMTDGMSDAEKVAKLFELTLEEGNKQLEAMGGIANTQADEMRALAASAEQAKIEFGELASEALAQFVWDLNNVVVPAVRDAIKDMKILAGMPGAFNNVYGDGIVGEYAKQKEIIDDIKAQINELNTFVDNPLEMHRDRDPAWLIVDRAYAKYQDAFRLSSEEAFDEQALGAAIKKRLAFLESQLGPAMVKLDKIKNDMSIEAVLGDIEEELARENKTTNGSASSESEKERKARLKQEAAEAKKAAAEAKRVATEARRAEEREQKALEERKKLFTSLPIHIEESQKELAKFLEETDKLIEKDALLRGVVDTLVNLSEIDFDTTLNQFGSKFDDLMAGTNQTLLAMNFMSGGLLGAKGNTLGEWFKDKNDAKKNKDSLAKNIAEAVSAGFANADFSNFALTIGSILSQVLSSSVSQKFQIIDTAGNVNWGNLGVNIGTKLAISALTQPGRFFGGREDKFKEETINAASDLRTRMGDTWVKSQETSLLPYITSAIKNELAAARSGYYGTQTGYSWSNSGNGIWSDRTRTYNLIDQGASAALQTLTEAIERAEKYNRNAEMSYELMSAQGYGYKALVEQAAIYAQAAATARDDILTLGWTDGTKDTADLAEAAHELRMTAADLASQLAQASAERTSIISEGFSNYLPWLDTLPSRIVPGGGLRISMRGDGMFSGVQRSDNSFWSPGVDVNSLGLSNLYDIFSDLQTSYMDRNVSPYLIDMVKQASTGKYEMEALKITDEDAWQKEYMDYLDRQIEVFEEVMRRQEAIFTNEAKAYEERAAALEDLESTIESYHQAKLEKLRRERELEEEEKRMLSERRQEQLEAVLTVVGELNQRKNGIVIIDSGKDDAAIVSAALSELMQEFRDNPEVLAVLQSAQKRSTSKAIWGKDA